MGFPPDPFSGRGLVWPTRWKFAAGRFDEEAFWLLGFEGLDVWNQLEACRLMGIHLPSPMEVFT
ncbi:hypothetical protein [Candidatus Villigracilis affinis]|uniref:hypothetical protein n=1 Tax=Candidatus Villigracilis affinis TaxID=3140682 RepID=UPI002A1B9778|nr:hypothetical protein [Anaerolineales bacterium]